MTNLWTLYGESVNREKPLPEHPNPLFRRDRYMTLNGIWDFAINRSSGRPVTMPKKIVVPFSVETPLSGIETNVKRTDYLHYRRKFHLSDEFLDGYVIIHFEAVDQICDVFLNGDKILHHEGGYLPFSCLISDPMPENILEVTVSDDTLSPVFPRGKQSLRSNGIWYTATSGIWQSVWLEAVPDTGYIKNVKIDSLFDEKKIRIKGDFTGSPSDAFAEVYYHGHLVGRSTFDEKWMATLDLNYDFYPWSPDSPELYELRFSFGEDIVHSYCALRKFSVIQSGNECFFGLNNHPVFLSGLLDQGYYPDGGLTPPSEKAMVDDIMLAKNSGFNCLRKHIKIEPMRWYYLCDTLGMLVFQDFVSGGSPYANLLIVTRPLLNYNLSDTTHKLLGRALKESRDQFVSDLEGTVNRLYNVPSICSWTIFNEGWGQFDSVEMTKRLAALDPSRPIDSTSGWYDKNCGNYSSHHIYFVAPHLRNDHKRILSLSECGGFSLGVDRHKYSKIDFGYARYSNFDSLNRAVERLYSKHILRLIKKSGLGEVIFTQLTDVESETNGLITYDRRVQKVDIAMLKRVNHELYSAFNERLANKK